MTRLKSFAELVRSIPGSCIKFVFCSKSLKFIKELGSLALAFAPKILVWAKNNAPYIAGGCAFVTDNQSIIYAAVALIGLYLALRD